MVARSTTKTRSRLPQLRNLPHELDLEVTDLPRRLVPLPCQAACLTLAAGEVIRLPPAENEMVALTTRAASLSPPFSLLLRAC
jgi:hypothetical protein